MWKRIKWRSENDKIGMEHQTQRQALATRRTLTASGHFERMDTTNGHQRLTSQKDKAPPSAKAQSGQ